MVILQAAPITGGTSNFSVFFIVILVVVVILIYYIIKYQKDSEIKYPALRIISGFYKALAEIIAALSIIIPIYLLSVGNQYNDSSNIISNISSISATSIFIGGIITATVLFAIAESIKVFIDMEENTRNAASILKDYCIQNIKEESKIFCENCGKVVAKDDKHCANCGNELKS